jgi:hypothetical protein
VELVEDMRCLVKVSSLQMVCLEDAGDPPTNQACHMGLVENARWEEMIA